MGNQERMGALDRSVLDAQVRASVNQKLEESGEKEKLKELLRKKLIERGWRDELKEYCKEVIKSKGLEQISVEDLVSEITPRGRATIPDDIKADLLERILKLSCPGKTPSHACAQHWQGSLSGSEVQFWVVIKAEVKLTTFDCQVVVLLQIRMMKKKKK